MSFRLIVGFAALIGMTSCGPAEPKWADDADVARATYRSGGPTSLTLYTVINNSSGGGGHAGLLVNASQTVMFDPAGTFYHPHLPERNDVVFGMTPRAVDFYIDYHARETYHVVAQTIPVSPEVAEKALQLVMAYGAVPKAQCSKSITEILPQLAGFEGIRSTMFPKHLMQQIAERPDVSERKFYDDSPDVRGTMIEAPGLLTR